MGCWSRSSPDSNGDDRCVEGTGCGREENCEEVRDKRGREDKSCPFFHSSFLNPFALRCTFGSKKTAFSITSLGLLALIKCSICSKLRDSNFASSEAFCHNYFSNRFALSACRWRRKLVVFPAQLRMHEQVLFAKINDEQRALFFLQSFVLFRDSHGASNGEGGQEGALSEEREKEVKMFIVPESKTEEVRGD